VKDNPQTEQIALTAVFGFVVFQVGDFWGDKTWGPTSDKQILFRKSGLCQTKIGDNAVEIIIFSEKNILRFKIPMHKVVSMHCIQSFQKTFHDHSNLQIREFLFQIYFVIQLPALEQFNDDID
jgi:hypothetical protein